MVLDVFIAPRDAVSRLTALALALLTVAASASGPPVSPPPADGPVTLGAVVRTAAEVDRDVRAEVWRQRRDEAHIEELRRSGGWETFLEHEQSVIRGDRFEGRDTSLGRSFRSESGDLNEDDWRVRAGLRRDFFGADIDRNADIALERLDQLDRLEDLILARHDAAFDAAEAYLSVVDGEQLAGLIAEQIAHSSDVARIFRLRSARGEALETDVLETEYDLAQLRQKALNAQLMAERELGFLRQIMGRPDLTARDLAPPIVPGATELANTPLEDLIRQALRSRTDLRAASAALEAATTFVRDHARILPDLELELGLAYRDRHRDWTDERRDDEVAELDYSVEIAIPLSIASRNRARRQRFFAEAEYRRLKVEDRARRTERAIRKAYEAWQLAEAECTVQDTRIAHAIEQERVTRLTADQLPELLGTSPEIALYRARATVLEVRSDRQRAEHARITALLLLAAETNRLMPESFEDLQPALRGERP